MSNSGTPLVELKDISIAFGGIKAVDRVSVDLYPGEVVGLLGHNGAGKSTLIKCLSGAYKADSGDVYINGKKVVINNPRDARRHNIETVYQTLAWPITLMRRPICFWAARLSVPAGFWTTARWKLRRAKSWAVSIRTSPNFRNLFPPYRVGSVNRLRLRERFILMPKS